MIPPGFEELREDSDLFYRIEQDGSVLLTGDKPMGAMILSENLPDGSKLRGGFNKQGLLFGERLAIVRGQVEKYPMHWREVQRSPSPSPARPTLDATAPAPKSKLDSALFDPPTTQKWETKKRPPSFSSEEFQQKPSRVAPEVREFLAEQGVDTVELHGAQERISKAIAKSEKPRGKIATKMQALLGNTKNGDDSGVNIEVLKDAAEAIEKAMDEVRRVQQENAQHAADVQRLENVNEHLRNELERVREEMKADLERITSEFGRKVKMRRLLVETARTHDITTEAMDSRAIEVEDPDGNIHYVVVSSVPSGTPQETVAQWQNDLRAKVDRMPFGQRAVYVLAPPGTQVHVLELLPGVDVEDTAAQF